MRVANALGQLPLIDESPRVGKLSCAKARALTRVATAANEAKLLDLALAAAGAQLERICRGHRSAGKQDRPCAPEDRSVRRRVLPGGMVKLEIVLSADEADLVMRAVDCAREVFAEVSAADVSAEACNESSAWSSRPDGVVALAVHYLAGNRGEGTGADNYQVTIHVDQDPLAPDSVLAATLEDGTGISAEAFRRIACDCGLVATAGNDPTTMTVGRRIRAIRRALRLRDSGRRFPGCTHTRFLLGHHVRHWLHGGETNLAILMILCPHHHHLVHEGGRSIDRDAEGNWLCVAPDGRGVADLQPPAWEGEILTWLEEWTDKHSLDLGPETNGSLSRLCRAPTWLPIARLGRRSYQEACDWRDVGGGGLPDG